MRCRGGLGTLALGSAMLMAFGLSGCGGSSPKPGESSSPLEFAARVQIDRDGAPVDVVDDLQPANPAGDGNSVCPPVSIAMAGALNGPDAGLGVDVQNGIQLAVDQHNAANPACQVQLKPFDTEGDPDRIRDLAAQIVDDAYTVGVVGPVSSAETQAAGEVFDRAGLIAATPSATDPALAQNGWRTFFRGVAGDGVQGPAVARYMSETLGYRNVCVVDDSSDYGLGLATSVRETLGAVADSACNIAVRSDATDFSGIVTQINAAAPDSVFFAGYSPVAAALVRQLREGGFGGAFVGADGAKNESFVEQAESAASGALLSCPCSPATPEFVDEYSSVFAQQPGPYSVEAYDLATILLKGIDSGALTRPALLEYVANYDGQGIARRYRWDRAGELENPLIWIYDVVE